MTVTPEPSSLPEAVRPDLERAPYVEAVAVLNGQRSALRRYRRILELQKEAAGVGDIDRIDELSGQVDDVIGELQSWGLRLDRVRGAVEAVGVGGSRTAIVRRLMAEIELQAASIESEVRALAATLIGQRDRLRAFIATPRPASAEFSRPMPPAAAELSGRRGPA